MKYEVLEAAPQAEAEYASAYIQYLYMFVLVCIYIYIFVLFFCFFPVLAVPYTIETLSKRYSKKSKTKLTFQWC